MCLGALWGEHSLKVARRARAGQTFPLCPTSATPAPPLLLPRVCRRVSAEYFGIFLNTSASSGRNRVFPICWVFGVFACFVPCSITTCSTGRLHFGSAIIPCLPLFPCAEFDASFCAECIDLHICLGKYSLLYRCGTRQRPIRWLLPDVRNVPTKCNSFANKCHSV